MLSHPDTTSHYPRRHPGNTNLRLYRQPTYRGLPLMIDKGPFVEEYLSRLLRVIQRALTQYPRVMAFRVDLNLPKDTEPSDYAHSNKAISRFIESFSGKIEYHRSQLREQKKDARNCRVRYAWAREVGVGEGRTTIWYSCSIMMPITGRVGCNLRGEISLRVCRKLGPVPCSFRSIRSMGWYISRTMPRIESTRTSPTASWMNCRSCSAVQATCARQLLSPTGIASADSTPARGSRLLFD